MRRFAIAASLAWGVLAAGLGLVTASVAQGQQAVFTAPSIDVTPAGHGFVMHESQLAPFGDSTKWESTHFVTYGVGANLEVAATLFSDWTAPDGRQTVAIGGKWSLPLIDEDWGVLSFVPGAMGLIDAHTGRLGHWLYAMVGFELRLTGTRIAVGISHATRELHGRDTDAMIFTFEQETRLVPGLSLVAEWFSGNHALANLAVGVSYHPDATWIFVAGYKVPTDDGQLRVEEQGFIAEVGVFWD